MTNSKASQVAHTTAAPGFKIVCKICDALGIVFDCAEGAPSSTQIKCRHCGALRGTLGELRNLYLSHQGYRLSGLLFVPALQAKSQTVI
jgi:hypothetical protein